MHTPFKLFLFTDQIATNPHALTLALMYQHMSAIGYVIKSKIQTSSDKSFYIRWKTLAKEIYSDLVNVDKRVIKDIEKYDYYLTNTKSIFYDYKPSDDLTNFLVSKAKEFFNKVVSNEVGIGK